MAIVAIVAIVAKGLRYQSSRQQHPVPRYVIRQLLKQRVGTALILEGVFKHILKTSQGLALESNLRDYAQILCLLEAIASLEVKF